MSSWDWATTITTGLGVSTPQLVLLVTACGMIILMAGNIQLGILLSFLFFGVETVLFYSLGQDISLFVLVLMMNFALLVLTLFMSGRNNGGYV